MIKKGELYYPAGDSQEKANIKDKNIYGEANNNPIKFWEGLAEQLFWQKKWDKAFVHNPPYFKWFDGGKINITENILEKNSAGFENIKNKPALIWIPESEAEKSKTLTYGELFIEVNRFANVLLKLGVKKGDRVGIYLPVIPEVVIAMLSCARIGAVHSVVFSAYSSEALRLRMQDAEAKVLITADGYSRRGKIVDLKHNADLGAEDTNIEKMVVVKRVGNKTNWQEGRDFWFSELMEKTQDFCGAEAMDAEDLFFTLYTSGSTGKPKGCCHTCGGYAVQAKFSGKYIFDFKEGDVFWCTADPGWITGHTYSIYSPLLNGITTLLFEGALDSPNPDRWAQIIEENKVTIFYTAPTAIRMFEKYGADIIKKYKFETLRILGSVGEPIDETAWLWYFNEVGHGKCPIVDTWWQTETGSIVITSLPGVGPFKPAFTGLPFPGLQFEILDEGGKECPAGVEGNLVVKSPFAPGFFRGVYKDEEKYKKTYWTKFGDETYLTSDGALKDENGLFIVICRLDDVIKVAGHRLTTGELESAVNSHPDIDESAVIAVPDAIKGEVPVVFVVYHGTRNPEEMKREVVLEIRQGIGPIAAPKEIYLVKDLPKTRSGKIMRRILRKLFMGEDFGDLSTLSNPEVVENIKQIIKK